MGPDASMNAESWWTPQQGHSQWSLNNLWQLAEVAGRQQISHHTHQLRRCGRSEGTGGWAGNCLSSRSQRAVASGTGSARCPVTGGVLQDSELGTLVLSIKGLDEWLACLLSKLGGFLASERPVDWSAHRT